MANRSWFFAHEGKQQGPYPEEQFRDFVARGYIRADTFVWTDGMADWQRAESVPGLLSSAAPPPPAVRRAEIPANAGSRVRDLGDNLGANLGGFGSRLSAGVNAGLNSGLGAALSGTQGPVGSGSLLSIAYPLWAFLGWYLVCIIGIALIVPAPWLVTMSLQRLIPTIQVPGRPNLGFTGQPLDIWYVLVGLGLGPIVIMIVGGIIVGIIISIVAFTGSPILILLTSFLMSLVLIAATLGTVLALSWMTMRWVLSNLSSNGQKLPITFEGSMLGFIGWYAAMALPLIISNGMAGFIGLSGATVLSFIAFIGSAWVVPLWVRWICMNIQGTRRAILFHGSGLEILWRTIVTSIACCVLFPIPWMLRWYTQWFVSQFELVDRSSVMRD